MSKKLFLVLAVICLGLASVALSFSVSTAQTTERARQATSPTPPPGDDEPPPLIVIDDTPIIVKAEVVNLNVRVIDRNNRPINTLAQKDFQIFEENVPQPIEFFAKEEVPTNYSLVVDNSNSMRFQLEKVIEASKIIIGTNKPEDETSIVRFVSSAKIEILQDFTANKEDLDYALDNLFTEGGKTAIIDAVYLAASRVEEYEKENRDERKRRALILVSDGEDRDSYYKEEQLYELLRESDVQIYAIGFVNELSKERGFIKKSEQGKAMSFLERIAKETGGKVYFPNSLNELTGIAQDIASELRTQYSIGYIPTNTENDGSFRTIKVMIADGPNKEKRIAITRTGRKAVSTEPAPTMKTPARKAKGN